MLTFLFLQLFMFENMQHEHLFYCNREDAEKIASINMADWCKIAKELSPLV